MSKVIDLKGERFGKLVVIERTESVGGRATWLCRCDCGNLIKRQGKLLRQNKVKSCGCLKSENMIKMNTKHGHLKRGNNRRLLEIWSGMKKRCLNKNYERYQDYGGRGITICDEWLSEFENFHNWAINNGYNDTLTIDRIDVDGNYEPSNCRWATPAEQNMNKRNTRYVIYNGAKYNFKELEEITGIPYDTLRRYYYDTRNEDLTNFINERMK